MSRSIINIEREQEKETFQYFNDFFAKVKEVTDDSEWLEYVIDSRRGGKLQQKYDLVEGGVANDNVIDTVEDYENGVITAEQALGQLAYRKVNHQICIHSQKIVDECVRFVEAKKLQGGQP